MTTFLVDVGDDNFCRVLPEKLDRSKSGLGRVGVMAFPPLAFRRSHRSCANGDTECGCSTRATRG